MGSITSVIERCNCYDLSSGLGWGGDIPHTVLGHDRIEGSNDGAIVAPTFLIHARTLLLPRFAITEMYDPFALKDIVTNTVHKCIKYFYHYFYTVQNMIK